MQAIWEDSYVNILQEGTDDKYDHILTFQNGEWT
jgi:hypothetical protein